MAVCITPPRQFRPFSFLLASASFVLLAGCSPAERARQSLRRGEPVQAVALFQQAVVDNPDDVETRAGLAEARQAAGAQRAAEARAALETGHLDDAVALASQAAQFDRAHRPLEQQARHALADDLLARSSTALNAGSYSLARRSAAAALETAPDRADPLSQIAAIDRAEAEDLRNRLEALLAAGDFPDAARLAKRAGELQPGDAAFTDLSAMVDQRRREAEFDALAAEAEAAITDGRLAAFWPMHARLAALNVRAAALAELQQRFDDREQHLLDTLDAAETARAVGNFERAVGLLRTAESIATDRPQLAEQRVAMETQMNAAQLQKAGRTAMDDGAYEQAIDALRRSLNLHAVAETDDLLREVERRWHRQSYRDALEHGNIATAVDHLSKLMRVQPDESLGATLQELRRQLIDDALAEASALHADDDTQTALHVLQRAMDRVYDAQLDALHATLTAELLLQQAVAAEQSGAYDQSRELYLEALAAGGDRQAIEARISDIRVLDDMQQRQFAAEHEADALSAALDGANRELDARERDVRELLDRLHDCEAEIARLVAALRHTEYDLHHEESRNRALESKVYALECEIDRLKDDLRRARADAQRRRSSSVQHGSRDDGDPRRPR